ncbi:hypothetical protein [Youngiibacter fragilis]|uniref:Ribbon-helix-helix protein CopG domain-containing protein n=1 Tax=Youngiibacter fragilis 232.1 TaxID=994573 RepID=V7I0L1_9CLOT|nr:hypothetical protein [Youngiibacter fragilis]ETA79418.1 hypothetical protein T472_0217215 [Youngiibacter fragilis 232.1]
MSKKIYSLLLSEEVMNLIDAECRRSGKSRSSLIDGILSSAYLKDHPATRLPDLLESLAGLLSLEDAQVSVQRLLQDAIEFRTSIPYSYQPKIVYRVRFVTSDSGTSAFIRIATRTTSAPLLTKFSGLFREIAAHGIGKGRQYLHIIAESGIGQYELRKDYPKSASADQIANDLYRTFSWIMDAMNSYVGERRDTDDFQVILDYLDNRYRF